MKYALVRSRRICKNCGAIYIWNGEAIDYNKPLIKNDEYGTLNATKIGCWVLDHIWLIEYKKKNTTQD